MSGRILRIITRLTVSGPSTHVLLLDRGLARLGWETLLVHGSIEPFETELDMSLVDVPAKRVTLMRRSIRPADDARAELALLRVIREYRPDIVHTHQSKAGLLGRSAATIARVPARVHTFHGTVFDGYFGARASAAVVTAERLAARATSRFIVLGDEQRRDLDVRGIARGDRVRVIRLGVDVERFAGGHRTEARAALGVPDEAIMVLAAGRLDPIKRIDRLLRAYRTAHDRRPHALLCIVGDGPIRPNLEAQAAVLGIAHAVRFVGWTDAMPAWFAAADVVANSSDNEGTPLTLIEAAAAGRPVVATQVGGIADVVDDGVTGFLVPRDDEAAFADSIVRLIDDPDLRATMGAAAVARGSQYASGRLVDDVAALYVELIDGKRASLPSSDRRGDPL